MSLIVQLSDIHLLSAPDEQEPIFEALIEALEKMRGRFKRSPDLLVITGDVFDTVSVDPARAVAAFHELQGRVLAAMGEEAPTIVVPGNHDRRRLGLLGPHRDDLFDHLAGSVDESTFVHGTNTPFLSSVVPHEVHGQPYWIIAYDSTYLPRGLVSAGGVLRQEDLLHAAARIDGYEPDWPVLFLLHHHLVPTPLTDVGHIEPKETHPFLQWGVKHVLPALVANADREELTMTALGAGTALSTLHSLGRAVLVLHGHKHYATARLLHGMRGDQGDVLIVSAGSCGTAQPWSPNHTRDTARLWPSFNVIELDEARAVVHDVSFGWKGTSAGRLVFRPLVNAQRDRAKWRLLPLPPTVEEEEGPVLACNRAFYRLSESLHAGEGRWDYRCVREVIPRADRPQRYIETVEGADGATVLLDGDKRPRELPERLELDLSAPTLFDVKGGVVRSLTESHRLFGLRSAPFSSIALMNRYRSEDTVLGVDGLPAAAEAFASMTDLGTGLESPAPLERVGESEVRLTRPNCPPRSLLRIYWPLTRPD
ncbi:MAG: metallophosphoesterase [Myxococcota bacterium]